MQQKKERCLILLTFIFLILIVPFSYAEECDSQGYMGIFQQNTNVTLTQSCPTCTTLNITVTDPQSEIVFQNVPMTLANNVFTFGPNSTISEDLGTYFVQGVSNLDDPFKSCFIITNVETQIDTPQAIIFIILSFFVFFIFLMLVWGAIGLPARNRRNELNRVIGIEYFKYLKLACIMLAYAFFVWLVNILVLLSRSLVTLQEFNGFFVMVFQFLLAGLYAFFVAMIVIFFIVGARDLKLIDLLTRGILPR